MEGSSESLKRPRDQEEGQEAAPAPAGGVPQQKIARIKFPLGVASVPAASASAVPNVKLPLGSLNVKLTLPPAPPSSQGAPAPAAAPSLRFKISTPQGLPKGKLSSRERGADEKKKKRKKKTLTFLL